MCFSAENNQTRIEIIFRGKSDGKYINEIEKQSYHKGVDVYWQTNAWADLDFSLKWVKKTLKQATQDSDDEFLLLCDNLGCQVDIEFRKAVRNINGLVYYGVKGNLKFLHFRKFMLLLRLPPTIWDISPPMIFSLIESFTSHIISPTILDISPSMIFQFIVKLLTSYDNLLFYLL